MFNIFDILLLSIIKKQRVKGATIIVLMKLKL